MALRYVPFHRRVTNQHTSNGIEKIDATTQISLVKLCKRQSLEGNIRVDENQKWRIEAHFIQHVTFSLTNYTTLVWPADILQLHRSLR